MDIKNDKYVVPKKEGLGESTPEGMGEFPGNTSSDRSPEYRRADSWDKSEKDFSDVYEKTGKAMNETYDRAKSYSCENPGTTVLIALGVGVGLGFVLGASTRHSRRNQYVEPITYALSDMVQKVLR